MTYSSVSQRVDRVTVFDNVWGEDAVGHLSCLLNIGMLKVEDLLVDKVLYIGVAEAGWIIVAPIGDNCGGQGQRCDDCGKLHCC